MSDGNSLTLSLRPSVQNTENQEKRQAKSQCQTRHSMTLRNQFILNFKHHFWSVFMIKVTFPLHDYHLAITQTATDEHNLQISCVLIFIFSRQRRLRLFLVLLQLEKTGIVHIFQLIGRTKQASDL